LPFQGPRVALRALAEHDLEHFHDYRCDPEVARYQGWSAMSIGDAKAFIDSMRDVKGPRLGAWIQLGIALKSNNRLIGDVGLHIDPSGQTAQIGYSCARPFQQQGLTTEAVRLLTEGVFKYTGCERIRASIDTRNIPSERLLLRLGFVPVGEDAVLCGDGAWMEVAYELLPAGPAD